MNALGLVLFGAIVVLYHEVAHALAAHMYGALDAVTVFHSTAPVWKWVVWGPAIQIDGGRLTDRQTAICLLAPLAYLPMAAPTAYLWTVTGESIWLVAASVAAAAAIGTLFSDVPAYLARRFGFENILDPNGADVRVYTLYRFGKPEPADPLEVPN